VSLYRKSPDVALRIDSVEVLILSVQPSNATIKGVTWTNSNPAVASVFNGSVTGLAIGSATITVTTTDGGKTASVTVPVVGTSGTPDPTPVDAATPILTALPPSSVTYAQNTLAEPLTVVAYSIDGGTLTYQWYRNTSRSLIGATLIQGAVTPNYTPLTNTLGTIYYYALVINNNNKATGSKTATMVCPFVKVTVRREVPFITISVGFGGAVNISGSDGQNVLSKSEANEKPSTLDLSATGFSDIKWYIDGEFVLTLNGKSSITLNAENYDIRTHSITFVGLKDGVPYSQELPFTVVK
jgi:hypothetical protein